MLSRRYSQRLGLCVLAIIVVASLPHVGAQGAYDSPPQLTATAILGAGGVKGPNYQIAEAVRTDQYFHEFTIASTYGSVRGASGAHELGVAHPGESRRWQSLEEVSKTEVFLASAAGQSVANDR